MTVAREIAAWAPADTDAQARRQEALAALATSGTDVLYPDHADVHFTVSGLVYTADGYALACHHPRFGRWQQPGGHLDDGDASLAAAVLREVREETGLDGLLLGGIVDIDVHVAGPQVRCGTHYDVRFAVLATGGWQQLASPEGIPLCWMNQRSAVAELEPALAACLAGVVPGWAATGR